MASDRPERLEHVEPATVELLLETVRGLVATENARSESFNARASGIAGFAGIVVSVSAAAGPTVLSAKSADWVRWTAAMLLGVALVALLIAIGYVVLHVLLPRSFTTLGMNEIRNYPSWESVTRPAVMVRGSLLGAYVEMLAVERNLADRKSRALRVAYAALAVGIGAIAVLAAILGFNELRVT